MDRPQLCSALIRTPRFGPDNGLDNGLEELALYLLSLL